MSESRADHHAVEWIHEPSTGGSPENDPRKARFQWKDGDAIRQTQDFTEEDLAEQIRTLGEEDRQVPEAFREALRSLEEGG